MATLQALAPIVLMLAPFAFAVHSVRITRLSHRCEVDAMPLPSPPNAGATRLIVYLRNFTYKVIKMLLKIKFIDEKKYIQADGSYLGLISAGK